jgi:hypothetical protein
MDNTNQLSSILNRFGKVQYHVYINRIITLRILFFLLLLSIQAILMFTKQILKIRRKKTNNKNICVYHNTIMPFLKVLTYIITGFTACPIRFAVIHVIMAVIHVIMSVIHVIMAVIHVIMAVLTIKTTVILYFFRLFFPCDFINIGSQKVIWLEMKMRQKCDVILTDIFQYPLILIISLSVIKGKMSNSPKSYVHRNMLVSSGTSLHLFRLKQ